jgi:hypothetical protein
MKKTVCAALFLGSILFSMSLPLAAQTDSASSSQPASTLDYLWDQILGLLGATK